MKLLVIAIRVDIEGNCEVKVTYPSPSFTCVQALQPKSTILAVQRRQEGLLKRCIEVNDLLPEFCTLVESRYAQMAGRVKTTVPLLRKLQGDLFAIQRSLLVLKKRLGA